MIHVQKIKLNYQKLKSKLLENVSFIKKRTIYNTEIYETNLSL